jgi:two-component system, OmpR family, sensor histidine kinase RstB
MRRLHSQFYLAILATIVMFLIASVLFWRLSAPWRGEAWGIEAAGQFAAALLPPGDAAMDQRQRVLERLRRHLNADLALYDVHGEFVAASGSLPRLAPRQLLEKSGWILTHGGPMWVLPLDDGRRIVMQPTHHLHPPQGAALVIVPLSIGLALVLGAYPIARRLTGRLARLQAGVEQLGHGNFTARVRVEGRDEVAALARSFNESASRIEELVTSHKMLLANCSHELRTPLARIRLGLERLLGSSDPAAREEVTRSIAELDALIGEMLLASRLDALKTLERSEDVDLLALAAEEAAHFEREVEGEQVTVRGDPNLLRRMIRNLLDNAQRHAGGARRIQIGTDASRRHVTLIVEDGGQGVAEADQQKIFEPFYRAGASVSAVGFGLGLAIVRQIARAHGGDVSYTAPASGGSRFVVTLPASARGADSQFS